MEVTLNVSFTKNHLKKFLLTFYLFKREKPLPPSPPQIVSTSKKQQQQQKQFLKHFSVSVFFLSKRQIV